MKKWVKTAAVMGITYLMNNKQARQKVFRTIQAIAGKNRGQRT